MRRFILLGLLTAVAVLAHPAAAIAADFDAPFEGAAPMTTAGTAYQPGRSVGALCTAAGNITFTLKGAGATTITVAVGIGWQTFPFAATKWALASGSSAACSFSELY